LLNAYSPIDCNEYGKLIVLKTVFPLNAYFPILFKYGDDVESDTVLRLEHPLNA